MGHSGRNLLAALALGLMAEPAFAQNPQACARIESDLERLSCFDRIYRPDNQTSPSGKGNRVDADATARSSTASNSSRKSGLPPGNGGKSDRGGGRFVPNLAAKSGKVDVGNPAAASGAWASSVTGDGGYVLRSRSKQQHRNIIGQQDWLELVVSCEINTTSLAVSFGGNIVASVLDRFKINLKIDDKPGQTATFAVSKNFKSVGLWRGADAIPVIKSLFAGSEVKITGAPFFSRAVTAAFPIGGLETAIQPLRKDCSW